MIGTGLLGHRLSALPIEVPVYQDPRMSIKALGIMFFRLTLATVGCYIVVLVVLVLSPFAKSLTGFIWSGITGVAILLGFVMLQMGINRLMVKSKLEDMRIVSYHIEDVMNKALEKPTSENLAQLKDLYEIQKRVNDMSEWPFNWKALWQLMTAVFVPLLLQFAQVVWK